jgi:hypothetical protein
MSKPFDRKLYAENDKFAKDVVSDFMLREHGAVPVPDIERYKDWDLVFEEPSGRLATAEVERKVVWTKDGEWQGWPTVDIPYRKKDSKADFFMMVNKNGTALMLITVADIKKSPVIVKDTKYTKQEKFFSIPVQQFVLYTKEEDGSWL